MNQPDKVAGRMSLAIQDSVPHSQNSGGRAGRGGFVHLRVGHANSERLDIRAVSFRVGGNEC